MDSIEKLFIPYQEALDMKLLGFNDSCFGYYSKDKDFLYIENIYDLELNKNSNSNFEDWITCPTYSQCFSWFREKYNLNYEISCAGRKEEYHAFVNNYIYGNNGNNPSIFSYEQAELEVLKQLIKIIKNY